MGRLTPGALYAVAMAAVVVSVDVPHALPVSGRELRAPIRSGVIPETLAQPIVRDIGTYAASRFLRQTPRERETSGIYLDLSPTQA